MTYPTPGPGAQFPPQRPERAWWWLPEKERRRRKAQRREWLAYKRRNKKKKDRDWSDACDGADCCCDLGDPCLIALVPVMTVAGVRFALTGGRGGRRGTGGGAGADPAAPAPGGFAAGVLYGAVRYYRTEVSPKRPACCPYTPSCSTYAVQALHRHGAVRGARLTVGRLLRCRPGVARRGTADPVPGR
ncbi:membrane protein insertion efficiency factor YidD [Kitasatospora sp. A2-31]|uniref:membrane protein insertion efficiency factor YidD n=1 Tax=Kitasatospora sp. A2-31 TaxID=2916414 RepID=UPI001EEA883A|nr:membrane protein insertion efficiency factor YidD [Kitasatospora sp. A2-31]MCG6497932.1 membrane protein insertion efficiency factor YidD [Kitasatospora sp. A2-31]